MSYRIDGSSHRTGVRNETHVANLLNEIRFQETQWRTKGGTQTLFDLLKGESNTSGSSVKHQTNSKSTFAWDNRGWSVLPAHILPPLQEFKALIAEARTLEKDERTKLIAHYRKELFKASHKSLLLLLNDRDWLIKYINNLFLSHYLTADEIFIYIKQGGELRFIKPQDLPIVQKLEAGWKPLLLAPTRSRVKSLRLRLESPEGALWDPGIQFRLKDTQGIKAFLGLSPKYKNSNFCVGLQQSGAHILPSTTLILKK